MYVRDPRNGHKKPLLQLVMAVVVMMLVAMPWASADDTATSKASDAASEPAGDAVEPTPTPTPTEEETEEPVEEPTEEPVVEPTEEPVEEPEETDAPEKETETTDPETESLAPDTQTKKAAPKAPPGNNGTVKVDGIDFDNHPNNEPKVGCVFQIDYTGFDPNQTYSHSFTIQSGDGAGTVLASAGGSLDATGAGSHTHDLTSALAGLDPKDDGRYHVKLDVSLPNVPGGQKHKVFKILCGSPPPDEEGFVIIEKEVLTAGAPAENFGFSGDLGNFSLGDGDTTGAISVEPGEYTVTETITNAQSGAGWSFDSVSCANVVALARTAGGGSRVLAASDHGTTFEVEDGETIKCTFKNEWADTQQEEGYVIVAKDVTTPGAPAEDFAFEGDFGNFTLGDGQETAAMTVVPGTFDVAEVISSDQADAGWSFDEVNCVTLAQNVFARRSAAPAMSTHNKNFTVGVDETVKCTFENVYEPGTDVQSGRVVIKKKVIGDVPIGPQGFSFDGTFGSFGLGDGDSRTFNVDPGAYNVSEDLSGLGLGWSLNDVACVEKDTTLGNVVSAADGALAEIDVSDGETVTCTYTNEYEAVLGTQEKKPPPEVLGDIIIRERQGTVLGTAVRRSPLPFTGNGGPAPLLLGLMLVAAGALIVRTTKEH